MTGVLELAILGLLKEQPMHGYDLRKRLRENFGPLANLSFGSLYPALARLEQAGAVQAIADDGTKRTTDFLPLTGSLGGERASLVARRATAKAAAALGGRGTRARKIYEITDHGQALFDELLDAPAASGDDASTFSLRLAFARHLSPTARIRMFERRRLQLTDRLERQERTLSAPRRPLDAYEQAIAEHARDTVARDLDWIEQLLDTERRDGAVSTTATPTLQLHGNPKGNVATLTSSDAPQAKRSTK